MKGTSYRPVDGEAREVRVQRDGDGQVTVRTGESERAFRVEPLGNGVFRLSDGSGVWRVTVDRDGACRHVSIPGVGSARIDRETAGRRGARDAAPGSLASPMPGKIVKVFVAVGDVVEKGQDLLVVEAMKMEIKVSAPLAGTVKALHAAAGDPCDGGQILAEVEPAETGADA
jgi:biotin carboxyl carrier protein